MRLPFGSNRRRVSSRPRRMGGRQVTTRSGRVLRVNSSVGGRWAEYREAKARRKVDRMRGLPKSRAKRVLWRLNPRRQAEYWFSRDGAIMALKIVGIGIFLFFVLTIGVFAFFRKDLQDIKDQSNASLGGSLAFYDRTGNIYLGSDYDKVKRIPVQNDQISQYIKDATVAVEDRDFYKHRGFDVRGIVRAGVSDIIHHGQRQGGSTITQQLVKLSHGWSTKRTVGTKIREIILAVELERNEPKELILQQYLNIAPYGSFDYGVQVAARDYFHKDAKDLNLAESAMLAAIPKSPNELSPYNKTYFDREALINRYNYVLDSMRDTGKITDQQARQAKKVNILAKVHKQPNKFSGILAPFFIKAAEDQIINKFGLTGPGHSTQAWKIITTLDMNMQKLVEQKVRDNIPNLRGNGGDETASVVEDVQTGQYLALVGGLDFAQPGYGQINFAQWPISPGSSFKPYDYSTLIENHTDAGAGSVLYDVVGAVPGYECTIRRLPPNGNCLWDFDRRSPGPMTIRYALGGSRNIPAVKAMAEAVQGKGVQDSVNKTVQTAERLMNNGARYACYKDRADVTKENKADQKPCYTSAGIGDGAYLHLDNHVNGLASLGRLGLSIPATYYLKIEDANGHLVDQWKQPRKGDVGVDQVVRPETAYILNNMLSDPNASYFNFAQKYQNYKGWRIAVKTGTTNNNFDGLQMAWTTKFAVGTWVGYHTRTRALYSEMTPVTLPVTRGIMTTALDRWGGKVQNWNEPRGIQHLPAFVSRYAFGTQSGAPSTDLYPSWYKQPGATSNATIDKVSGKLATKCTPALARQNQSGFATANRFSIDYFYGARAQAAGNKSNATDDVHSCSDSKPSVDAFFINGQDVSGGGSVSCSSKCKITATVSAGTHPFNDPQYPQFPGTVQLLAGGGVIQSKSVSGSPSTVSFTYSGGATTLSIEVIDSVLYSARSAGAHVKGASSSSGPSITSASPSSISWTGGTPNYNVFKKNGSPVANCINVSGTSCSPSGLNNGDKIYVEDADGKRSGESTVH